MKAPHNTHGTPKKTRKKKASERVAAFALYIVQKALLLGPTDTVSQGAKKWHIGFLLSILASGTAAVFCLRAPGTDSQQVGSALVLVPFSIYILEREASILFKWPLSASGGRRGVISTRPMVLWLVSATLFASAMAAPEPLYLVQGQGNIILKALAVICVVLNAMPFWVATFLYLPLRRNALAWGGKKGILGMWTKRRDGGAPGPTAIL